MSKWLSWTASPHSFQESCSESRKCDRTKQANPLMLTTYERLLHEAKMTRHREATYDNRDPRVLLREYAATIDVLRWEIQRLTAALEQATEITRG